MTPKSEKAGTLSVNWFKMNYAVNVSNLIETTYSMHKSVQVLAEFTANAFGLKSIIYDGHQINSGIVLIVTEFP